MRVFHVYGLAVAIFFSCAIRVSASVKGDPKEAAVRVTVIDGLGQGNLQGGNIKSFKNLRTGQDLAARFHLNRSLEKEATQVPFGNYDLILTQPGFPDAERPVDVFATDVDVQVCVRTATVHIVDVGAFHNDFPNVQVRSFRNEEDDFDLARRFQENTATRIPYGTYHLVVTKQYAMQTERYVDVFQPNVWVVVELEFDTERSPFRAPNSTLTGTVTNIASNEQPLYVSLIGIHTAYHIDDKVNISGSSGTFSFAGFMPELKLLLITSDQHHDILDIRQIKVPSDKPIVIDLGLKRNLTEQH